MIYRKLLIVLILLGFSPISNVNGQSNCSTISIYRPNVLSNSLVNFEIYVNDVQVASLSNNAVLQINVETAGTYEITSKFGFRGNVYRKKTMLPIEVACNTNYFVKIKSGAFEAVNLLKEVHESIALSDINNIPNYNVSAVDVRGNASSVATPPSIVNTEVQKKEEPINNPPIDETRSTEPVQEHKEPQPTLNTRGKSYALIIGVNEYSDYSMNDLDQPISDAGKLRDVLLRRYTFTSNTIFFLSNPTKIEITAKLDYLYKKLNSEDNLIIFYAGHGYWDEQFQQGYWLASDAQKNNRGTWLSNGTIRDYIRAMPSKHTLLITDACFGGGIFKSRAAFTNSSTAINQLYKLPSRKAMTSGAMSEVPDKSVFIQYLVKRLEENQDLYLSSEQLFASFKIAVINNSANSQVPQFGEVRETGDEGGDYIFVLKK